ncbi:MAG TPA: tyrosine-protein phosphatase [Candidatus Binatia bacterium]|nr:tyrosine-protein phosphatase [Candidatus Binatia bacterium]
MISERFPRTLTWDGCRNVRDLGGIPTEDGDTTRSGRVIRADNIGKLTPDGWRTFERHGIARVVDLRFPEERTQDPPRGVDVEVTHVSVLGPSANDGPDFVAELVAHLDSVDDVADHYAWSYVRFLERNRERFGQALTAVAEADGPVVIHCASGKDRTGLVTSLLLRLAGVSAEEIGHDYALSGPNLAAELGPWLESAPDPAERRRREKISQTPAAGMRRVVEDMEAAYETVAGYLEAAGVTAATIDRLRTRLR